MPKSKRDRAGTFVSLSIHDQFGSNVLCFQVSLTVTKKKGLEFKQNLISEVEKS